MAKFDRSPTKPVAEGYRRSAEILKRFPGDKSPEQSLDDYALVVRHAGPDGHEADPGPERRGTPLLSREASGEDDEGPLKGDDRKKAERNGKAWVWIAGLEAVQRTRGLQRVIDRAAGGASGG